MRAGSQLITIGDRHIRGVVPPRRDAKEMFAEARKGGWVVALLNPPRRGSPATP